MLETHLIRIDETASLDQEIDELFFPAGKPLAVSRRCQAKDSGAFRTFDAEDLSQDNGQADLALQTEQQVMNAGEFCLFHNEILLSLDEGAIGIVQHPFLNAQGPQKGGVDTATLKISMSGFNNEKGSARMALCNSKEDYKKRDGWFRSAVAAINGGKAEWTFADLPFGSYAVKAYHDENNNGRLDTNVFGTPKEPYGFSNNARGTFGPPSFEEARFTIDRIDVTIHMTVE